MANEVPRWSQITSDPRWINSDDKKKAEVREKWLKDLYAANPDISKERKRDIETRTYLEGWEEQPQQPQMQTVAQTPQVEVNPPPFNVTMEEMIGMPPGTAIMPSRKPGQAAAPPADTGTYDPLSDEKLALYGEAAKTGIKRAPYAAEEMTGKAGQVLGKYMQGIEPVTKPGERYWEDPMTAFGRAFQQALPAVAQDVINIATSMEEEAGDKLKNELKISDRVQNDLIARGIANGFEMLGPSAVAIIPSILTGNPLPAMALTGGLFGLSAYKDTYDELVDAGVPEEEAFSRALLHGISEGGIESISTVIELMTAGIAKPLTAPAKEIAKTSVKSLIKKMAKIYGTEYAEEVAQGASEKFLKDKYKGNPNVQNISWKDLFVETLVPVAISTLTLSGAGEITSAVRNRAAKAQEEVDNMEIEILKKEQDLLARKPKKRPLGELKTAEEKLKKQREEEAIVRKGKGFVIKRKALPAPKKEITGMPERKALPPGEPAIPLPERTETKPAIPLPGEKEGEKGFRIVRKAVGPGKQPGELPPGKKPKGLLPPGKTPKGLPPHPAIPLTTLAGGIPLPGTIKPQSTSKIKSDIQKSDIPASKKKQALNIRENTNQIVQDSWNQLQNKEITEAQHTENVRQAYMKQTELENKLLGLPAPEWGGKKKGFTTSKEKQLPTIKEQEEATGTQYKTKKGATWTIKEVTQKELDSLSDRLELTEGQYRQAAADHSSKTIYVPKYASEKTKTNMVEHEKAHVDIAENEDLQEVGENILDNVRTALMQGLTNQQIQEEGAVLPETVEHMKKYMDLDMNEAALIEEAYAAEVGFQNAKIELSKKKPTQEKPTEKTTKQLIHDYQRRQVQFQLLTTESAMNFMQLGPLLGKKLFKTKNLSKKRQNTILQMLDELVASGELKEFRNSDGLRHWAKTSVSPTMIKQQGLTPAKLEKPKTVAPPTPPKPEVPAAPSVEAEERAEVIANVMNKHDLNLADRSLIDRANRTNTLPQYIESIQESNPALAKDLIDAIGIPKTDKELIKTKEKQVPPPSEEKPKLPPVTFRSGASKTTDMMGYMSEGADVGVVAGLVSKDGRELLMKYPGRVFIDSGAFGQKNINFDKVLDIYEAVISGRKKRGRKDRTTTVVAPDVVGDQKATLEIIKKYKDRIKKLDDLGADVVIALQKGDVPPIEFYKQVRDVLGFDFSVGIPLKKATYSPKMVRSLFEGNITPSRVHLLGVSEFSRKIEDIMDAIPKGIQITSDAARILTHLGKGKTITETKRKTKGAIAEDQMIPSGLIKEIIQLDQARLESILNTYELPAKDKAKILKMNKEGVMQLDDLLDINDPNIEAAIDNGLLMDITQAYEEEPVTRQIANIEAIAESERTDRSRREVKQMLQKPTGKKTLSNMLREVWGQGKKSIPVYEKGVHNAILLEDGRFIEGPESYGHIDILDPLPVENKYELVKEIARSGLVRAGIVDSHLFFEIPQGNINQKQLDAITKTMKDHEGGVFSVDIIDSEGTRIKSISDETLLPSHIAQVAQAARGAKPQMAQPVAKQATSEDYIKLAYTASRQLGYNINLKELTKKHATFAIEDNGPPIALDIALSDIKSKGVLPIVNGFRQQINKFSNRQTILRKKSTKELIKEAGKNIGKIAKEFTEEDIGAVGNIEKERSKQYKQAKYELKLIARELYKRFKRGGQKRFKSFSEYLSTVHKMDNDRVAIIDAEVQRQLRKKKAAKKEKQMPEELLTRLEEAGGDAEKAEMMFNDTEMEAKRIAAANRSWENTKKKLKTQLVDVSANAKKALLEDGGEWGRTAVIDHDLIRGGRAKAGRIIDEASKDIYRNLSKDWERLLNRMILARRIITIEGYKPDVDHPYGLGKQEMEAWISSLDEDTRVMLNERADMYFDVMRNQLTDMYKAGLITEKEYNALKEKGDYSPRNFLKYIDPEETYDFGGGKKISVPSSGIKKLDDGDFGLLEMNSRKLMHQVVTRTQTRILRNMANGSLYALAKAQPNNNIVKLWKGDKKAPPKWEKIKVMIDGHQKTMIMPKEIAQEWIESDPALGATASNIAGWLSGTKILKAMATGLNPEFALTNMPRDIAHIWLTTEEYSPQLFWAPFQMAADLWKVKGDAFFRRGAYIDYINDGGGMEMLVHQGRFTGDPTGGRPMLFGLTNIQKVMGYVGETSELLTRLALRNRAMTNLRKKGITDGARLSREASWIARNYLDFAQGGNLTKAADTVLPYLNASIQGTRGIFRAAAKNKGLFAWKVAQIGALATGLYLANLLYNKDTLDEIRPRDKVNNWIITTPWSYTDKNGEKRYLYFKIAKDQGQRVVATLFESLMAKFMGEKVDGGQIAQSIADFVPMMPTQAMPPVMDAIMGYASNVDFWSQEDIWRGPTVSPEKEYTKYTHPAFVGIGKVTGLSPDRTRFALQQFFTYGNLWTSIVGLGTQPIFQHLTPEQKEEVTQDMLRQHPFIRRALKATDPYTKWEKEAEKETLKENDRRYEQTLRIDELTDKWLTSRSDADKQKVMKFIRDQGPADSQRLLDRVKNAKKTYMLRDKKWWMTLQRTPPEARARIYWSRLRAVDAQEQERLKKQLRQLPEIASPNFRRELKKLQRDAKEAGGRALVRPY